MKSAIILAVLLAASSVFAQELTLAPPAAGAAPSSDPSTLTLTLDSDRLRDLPTNDSLYQALETMVPSTIADRFSGGGLSLSGARVGGFFGSPSQTDYRLGALSIADPTGSGRPLFVPDLSFWQRVRVTTGMMPLTANAPGLTMALDPLEPSSAWVRTVYGSTAAGSGQLPASGPPTISRLGSWNRGAGTAAGPLIEGRLDGAFAASWTSTSEFDRQEDESVPSEQGSVLAHLIFTGNNRQRVTTIAWLQRVKYPFALRVPFGVPAAATADQSGHLQLGWERPLSSSLNLRAFGGYTRRVRTHTILPEQAVFERLTDGPLDQVSFAGPSTVHSWAFGSRLVSPSGDQTTRRHHLDAGIEVSGARNVQSSMPAPVVGELVNGLPARVWKFSEPPVDSRRSATAVKADISDHISFGSRLALDAGLAFDAVSGSAESAATGVSWQSALPRASVRWTVVDAWAPTLFAGYRRAAYTLPLDLLAVGDPAAPVADVFRWDAASASAPLSNLGPLVARAGFGTGGDVTRSAIADDLQRPTLDEVVIGFSVRPMRELTVQVAAIKRRERNLFALTNTGVSSADYSVIEVPDVGIDVATTEDDGVVTVFNRSPPAFGRDRFLLTNQTDEATSESVEVSIQYAKQHMLLFVGGSASRTDGAAANRGYGPLENDEGTIGEVFADPNAQVFARGRLFTDRAYTGKVIGIFPLPARMRLGLLARYQDGQPFGRVVVTPGLNQGAEAVRAYANGGSRFTYTGTLDLRFQKTFNVRRFTMDAILDAYNLPNMSNEVEEDIVTGPGFRTITAVQPSRAFHLGMRVTF